MLTKEQLEQRRNGIGGSDAAAILGMSNFKTPWQVYLEKTDPNYDPGFTQDQLERMEWGNLHEPTIADKFASLHDVTLSTRDKTYAHRDHPWMLANIDRHIDNWGEVLEIKTMGEWAYKKEEWENPDLCFISPLYYPQLVHYAAVCDVPKVHLAVLIGGNKYREFTYIRNMEHEKALIERERNFWFAHVLVGIPPDAMNLAECIIKNPATEGLSMTASNDVMLAIADLQQIKFNTKAFEKQEEQIKIKIMEQMKDAEYLFDAAGRPIATWKQTKTGRSFRLAI